MSRIKEIIKIRAEINKIESKKAIQKINKIKVWLFVKINKIDKPLTRLIQKKRERTQIKKIVNEREVKNDTKKIEMIGRKYYQQTIMWQQSDNLEEMDKFLKTYNLPKLNQEESENLNR